MSLIKGLSVVRDGNLIAVREYRVSVRRRLLSDRVLFSELSSHWIHPQRSPRLCPSLAFPKRPDSILAPQAPQREVPSFGVDSPLKFIFPST